MSTNDGKLNEGELDDTALELVAGGAVPPGSPIRLENRVPKNPNPPGGVPTANDTVIKEMRKFFRWK